MRTRRSDALPPEALIAAHELAAALKAENPAGIAAAATRLRARLAVLGAEAAEPAGAALRRQAGLRAVGAVAWPRGDVAWVLIHAADGRLREAALRGLDGMPAAGFELAAVLHRLNDWVPQVRAGAEAWLARHAEGVDAGLAAGVLMALWPRCMGFTRWSPAGRAALARLADRADVLAALARLLAATRTGRPGELLRLAMRAPGFDAHLPALALGAALPVVRAAAVDALLSGRVSWRAGIVKRAVTGRLTWTAGVEARALALDADRLAVAEAAARDRAASVRKLPAGALPDLARLDRGRARAMAQALAADRNAAVRMRAQWWMGQANG